MKRAVLLFAAMMLGIMLSAQTQQGYVKTKGRMVDGKHVPGQGLKGATVSIKGRTTVLVEKDDGTFSFPVPSQTFMVEGVHKNGYQLVDVDDIRKTYNYSSNPIYLVMETPEQQMQDQLESERKIRRTLQRQLQQHEDELEALKEAHEITLEEYQQAMQKLYADQKNNEKLIADMAQQYAQMDYDQMDELNQRISNAILNGRLTEADSLLRSKGDMKSRVAEIKREQQVEAQRETEIAQAQKDLSEAMTGTQKKLEDIAKDCKKFFDLCKLNMEWDSAAYYIELRADLDSTNHSWQYDAAYYFNSQNDFDKAEYYFSKDLNIIRNQNLSNHFLLATMNGLALVYENTQRFTESEMILLEALETCRHLDLLQDNCKPELATLLTNLGNVYRKTQQFSKSEVVFNEALEIRRKLATDDPNTYEHNVAATLINFANMYYSIQCLSESEAMYLEALEILKRQAKDNPHAYEPDIASTLNNLAVLYNNTQRFKESEAMHLESLEIIRKLAIDNPQAYEPDVALKLNNIASMYYESERFTESEMMYLEALEIYRRLAKDNPQAFEPDLARTMSNIAVLYKYTQHITESEKMNLEAIEIYRRLAKDNPQTFEPNLARVLNNLASLFIGSQHFKESEELLLEALEINRRLVKGNPEANEPSLAKTLIGLTTLYSETHCYEQSVLYLKDATVVYQHLAQSNPQKYESQLISVLGNLSHYCIRIKHYTEAEQYAREALAIDSTKHWIYPRLAIALHYQGKYDEAEAVHQQLKDTLIVYQHLAQSNPLQYKSQLTSLLGRLSYYNIWIKHYVEAEQYAREAISIDTTMHWICSNLAVALLFQGKYDEAEQIYRQYKDELINTFLQDFDDLEIAGIIPEERRVDVERIKKLLTK